MPEIWLMNYKNSIEWVAAQLFLEASGPLIKRLMYICGGTFISLLKLGQTWFIVDH